jgi:GH24 family phage-related lysozyme (muramidase)
MENEYWKNSPLGKDSIFHPSFDEKLKEKRQNGDVAKITDMYVDRNIPNVFLPFLPKATPDSSFVPVVVMVNVIVSGYADKVEIALEKGARLTASRKIGTNQFQRLFTLQVPKSFASKDQYNSKDFTFTATVTDVFKKAVIDTRSVKIKIDTNGKIEPLPTDISLNSDNSRKPINSLKPSLNLFNFLKELEDIENVTYNDKGEIIKFMPYGSVEGGAQTIGWGHKIKKGESFSSGITKEQAEELLVKDVQTEGIDKLLNFTGNKKITVPLNQNEFDAVVSAIFGNGYGETLAAAINKGADYYSKNPETIYKAFLTRRYAEKKEYDGLIKRRAREADVFIKNQWHSYGPSEEKYKNDKQYIDAFKKFLKTGMLPIIIILSFFLIRCKTDNSDRNTLISENLICNEIDSSNNIKLSDSLLAALNRIEITDDGIGSYVDVSDNYAKEKEQWLQEIELIRTKLSEKVKKECPEHYQSLIEYNQAWDKFMESQRNFVSYYIGHYYRSGVSIFPTLTFYREEYKQRLSQYYFLYEIDEE